MRQGQQRAAGRAPRLGPDDSIATYFTRVGRFRRIDPTVGRPLPGVARWLGTIGWAALLAATLRRARIASRQEASAGE